MEINKCLFTPAEATKRKTLWKLTEQEKKGNLPVAAPEKNWVSLPFPISYKLVIAQDHQVGCFLFERQMAP
jgi:hypothetical protein